jgi:hypothetical protein
VTAEHSGRVPPAGHGGYICSLAQWVRLQLGTVGTFAADQGARWRVHLKLTKVRDRANGFADGPHGLVLNLIVDNVGQGLERLATHLAPSVHHEAVVHRHAEDSLDAFASQFLCALHKAGNVHHAASQKCSFRKRSVV